MTKKYLLSVFLLLTISISSQSANLSLHILDCGTILSRQLSLFNPNLPQHLSKIMANGCYLVVHPNGTLLWDTGIKNSVGAEGIDTYNGAFNFRVTQSLVSQLDALGFQPSDIDLLAMSHLHGDHAGNANTFSKSQWLVQEAEWQAANSKQAERFGFTPEDYRELKNPKVIKGDYDVFGDGLVKIISAPGHTPGHQMLLVELAKTGPVLLSGDLYHFRQNHIDQGIPVFNDAGVTRKTFAKIDQLIERTGATLWYQHDFEQFHLLTYSGSVYQ